MEKRPVIPVTVAFMLSLALARHVPLSIPEVVFLAVFTLLAAAGINALHRSSRFVLILVIFSVLGILIMKIEEQNPIYSSLDAFLGKSIVIEAQVISSDERGGARELVLQPFSLLHDNVRYDTGKAPHLLLRYFENKTDDGRDFSDTLQYGDAVRVTGYLEALHSPLNPGMPDFTEIRRREGIGYAFFMFHGAPVLTGRGGGMPFIRYILNSRDRILSVMKSNHRGDSVGLLTGVIFGGSSELSEPVVRAFRITGTYHILSASGMNVAILIVALVSLFKVFSQSGKKTVLLVIPFVVVYSIMAGGTSSVIRAAIMAVMAVCAGLVERRHDLLNTLFVAVFIMLVFNPLYIYDAGFQMSALAVLGIVIIMPLMKPLIERLPFYLRGTGEIAAVSLAVQIAIAPILAWHFNQLSLLAPLCNIVIVPPVGIVLYCGLIEGVAGIFLPMLGTLIALFSETLILLIIRSVEFLSRLPFCSICLPRPSLWSCVVYYLCLGLIIAENKRLVSRALASLTARIQVFAASRGCALTQKVLFCFWVSLSVSVIIVIFSLCGNTRELRAVFLDVGQGDSFWLSLPGGHQILLDGGPSFRMKGEEQIKSDAGERIIVPVLQAHGVGRIDLMLLSHGHEDHSGGVDSIVRNIKVDSFGAHHDGLSELHCRGEMKVMTEKGVEILPLSRGNVMEFTGGAFLRVLSSSDEPSVNDNERCLVIQLVYHRVRMLFTADCDEKGEKRLLDSAAHLKSDLLKVGHHGSATSTSVPFLDEVSPRYAVISCGWKNRMGHPSPDVVERMRSRGIKIFRTDCDGAVIATSDGESLTVKRMKKHPAPSPFQ
ncbi:MAG: DNA internalization-related competence protein ComEC/Rec2 [Vulcanimicrobiota bacterium]